MVFVVADDGGGVGGCAIWNGNFRLGVCQERRGEYKFSLEFTDEPVRRLADLPESDPPTLR